MVKIAVAGAKGHMGKMIIDAVWNTEGAELVAALAHKGTDKWEADEDAGASLGYNTGVKITDDYNVLRTCSAQVLIDFTRPEGTKEFLKICADVGIGMVIGTTGLDAEGKAAIEESAKVIPIVFSPNMSAGVNVTYKLLELAAKLLKDYDAEIFEMHHSRKVDAPSGTAIAMGKAIAEARGQKLEDVAVWAREGSHRSENPGFHRFCRSARRRRGRRPSGNFCRKRRTNCDFSLVELPCRLCTRRCQSRDLGSR